MKNILTIITGFIISFNAMSQIKKCKKTKKTTDLNAISKCKFKQKTEDPKKLNRTYTRRRNHKKNKNKNIKVNIAALQRSLTKKEFEVAKTFSSVDRIPTFKKCANLKGKKRLNCFNNSLTKHIDKQFHYPNKAKTAKIKGKVMVRFIIGKNGEISNIEAKGPKNGKLLIKEAKRIISNLPTLLPGKEKGKKVSVNHEATINFKL